MTLLRPPGFDTLPVRTLILAALPLAVLLRYAAKRGLEVG